MFRAAVEGGGGIGMGKAGLGAAGAQGGDDLGMDRQSGVPAAHNQIAWFFFLFIIPPIYFFRFVHCM